MTTPRLYQTATVLQNGQVLVIGGSSATTALNSAELYDPATGTWTATGSMTTARTDHTATLLQNGQVLVTGGNGTCVPFSCPALSTAELYHPATGTWAPTGSMTTARTDHTATPLPNGQVLAAGGETQNNKGTPSVTATADLYTP